MQLQSLPLKSLENTLFKFDRSSNLSQSVWVPCREPALLKTPLRHLDVSSQPRYSLSAHSILTQGPDQQVQYGTMQVQFMRCEFKLSFLIQEYPCWEPPHSLAMSALF